MKQLSLFGADSTNLMTLKESAEWASAYLSRVITTANISYLLQYGRIKKYGTNGSPLIHFQELKSYYDHADKEQLWKEKLGQDLNWRLSFVEYKESERTKHVHRLHPYKGKFIPQLVEYFLDSHTDIYKQDIFFQPGDIVLDPFCGSGTTLVQSNELGMHGIGIDISAFNALISNVKIEKHNILDLHEAADHLTQKLQEFIKNNNYIQFEENLLSELSKYNAAFFPSPDYKRKVQTGEIHEADYTKDREQEFLKIYHALTARYHIKVLQDKADSFLDKWFLFPVREQIDFLCDELKQVRNQDIQQLLAIILSRSVRSCRATTHADLGTLKEPVTTTYYCKKHGKICKPIFSINGWWQRYVTDTLNRLKKFDKLRTDTFQVCLIGDSRMIEIHQEITKKHRVLAELLLKQKIKGIFSSPPYVGLINYHEQHAYSYEILGFIRKDELEIGPLFKGQGKEARESYVKGIAESLNNCKQYFQDDYHVFLVANDKYNLYPDIARLAGMKIINQFKRPVLNRVEKDRSNAYTETIFHLKEQ